MRVALVVERLAPSGGGVEAAAWQTATALANAGESVHVLCREHAGRPDGVAVIEIRASALWQPWRVSAFSRRTGRALARASETFDVVHSFARTAAQDVYRAGAGRHLDFMRSTHGRAAGLRRVSPRHAVALAADRRIFRDTRQWIQCPSRRVRDEITAGAGVDPERTVVIPNGVDTTRFRPGCDDASQAIRAAHARAGETVWLLAGSGGRRKGFDLAIRALARARGHDTVLWVSGRDAPGPWRALAQRSGVASRVRWLGARTDMPDVLRAADGLLLPTRYDPFANASLEAAACGLPVVSTRQNGAMEVIDDGGLAVDDPEDTGALARALDDLADPAARAAMGERARKRALVADWTSHAERLRELYGAVIERRRSRAREQLR